ncbi:hypothetical protein [Streptomyces sp. NRRL S-337]|uniref:hypothetical protein n=1 Tax=Streptomyces sp. NRRL S-337 TaxID=1463900 RepID=UPI0004C7B829|nr:hypothetical protein [Streptomyces sp. NRRL S-337]
MNAHQKTPPVPGRAASRDRSIRMGYAAIGLFMAFTWMGGSDEPPWAHALRAAVMLLIVPPLLLPTNRHLTHKLYEAEHPAWAVGQLIGARILILSAGFGISMLLGVLLYPHAERSLTSLGVRVLLLLLTVPLQIRQAHRTRAHTVHPSARPTVSAPRLMAAKFTLIIAALLAELLLMPHLSNAGVVVAVGIFVTTLTLGPKAHHQLMVTQAPTTDRKPVGDTV